MTLCGEALAQTVPTPNPTEAAPPAGDAADASDTGDITVTARRREESVLDVPIPLSVVGAAAIAQANLKDITDIQKFTPGFTFLEGGAGRQDRGSRSFIIRGLVPNAATAIAPTTSLFIDGAAVGGGQVAGLNDVERVEILRGPQSVYFGRGTFAGAVNIVTKRPRRDRWGGAVSAEIGAYGTYELNGAIEGPVVRDLLSVRVSGRAAWGGGYYDNTSTQPGASSRLGERKTKALSAAIYATPAPGLTLRLYGSVSALDDGAPASGRFLTGQMNCALGGLGATKNYICGTPPAFPRGQLGADDATDAAFIAGIAPYSLYGGILGKRGGTATRMHTLNGSIRYEHPTGWSVESLTALNYRDSQIISDEDARATTNVPNSFYNGSNGFRPYYNYVFAIDRQDRDFSQDVRLFSPQTHWLRGTLGVNYTHIRTIGSHQQADSPLNPEYRFFSSTGHESAKTVSVYGGVYVDFLKQLTLSLEARQQKDKVYNQPIGAGGVNIPGRAELSTTYNSFSPRVSLDYKPVRDVTFYALFARGYRPGGFNTNLQTQPANIVAQIITQTGGAGLSYGQERLDDYEVGVKGRLWNGRVTASLNFYTQKLYNSQTRLSATVFSAATPPQPIILTITANQGEVKLNGFEFETAVRVTPQWTLSGNFADNRTEQQRVFCSLCRTLAGGDGIIEGTQLPVAPRYTGTVSSVYTRELFGRFEGFVRLDYRYESTKYSDLLNVLGTGDRHIVDLRAGIGTKTVKLDAYVTNLFDDDTYLNISQALDISPGLAQNSAVSVFLPQPRVIGARVRYDF